MGTLKPEDITGIDPQGVRVHCEGCSCDYNELTHRRWIEGTSPLEMEVIIERPIFHVDPNCEVHRG